MRLIYLVFLYSFLVLGPIQLFSQSEANNAKLDQNLIDAISQSPEAFHPVTILLSDYVDVEAMDANFYKLNVPIKDRVYTLITSLKAKAAATQGPLLDLLNASQSVESGSITPLWIANLIQGNLKKDMIIQLSHSDDIELIEMRVLNTVSDAKLAPASPKPKAPNRHEPGHDAINAPAFWKLGYTGYGRKVLVIDTGVDYTHPALAPNYYGNYVSEELAWYTAPWLPEIPEDCHGHGTHVTGTTVGLDPNTKDTIGVAPNGLWMGAKAIAATQAGQPFCPIPGNPGPIPVQQWAMDPDGNPNTIHDMPDVINASYGSFSSNLTTAMAQCNGSIKMIIDALEAAGIAMVYAAGNDGSLGTSTMSFQGNINTSLVKSFSVGSVIGANPSHPISSFSSRGPSVCGGTGAINIKPEVVAPGQGVRSAQAGGGYVAFSGTSMAAPHVAGAILLLKEAFPNLTGTQLKLALYYSAIDLGQVGEDNIYGNGIIDIIAAYNYLIGEGNTPVIIPDVSIALEKITNTDLCDSVFTGIVTIKNNGTTILTSLDLEYTLSTGSSNVHSWTGNLAPDQTIDVILPIQTLPIGSYNIDVEILTANGAAEYFDLDNTVSLDFSLFGYREITADPVNACQNSPTMLFASSSNSNDIIKWFETPTSSIPIGSGNSFITPPLTSITPYYVGLYTKAQTAKQDTSGSTVFVFPSTGINLIFDVISPITLKSVAVYNKIASNQTIVVRDENNNLVASDAFFVDEGYQRLELNFNIPIGENYTLGIAGSNTGLYSSINGFSFPYGYNGIVSITGSNNNYYNHFYDWEIEHELPCERMMTFSSVSSGNITADFSIQSTTVNISQPQEAKFFDQSVGATEWNWSFGDGTTSTEQNPTHNYTEAGIYTVALSVLGKDFCTIAVTKTIEAVGEYPYSVGVEDLEKSDKITIYPNPNNGKFYLLAELEKTQEVNIKVYNLIGAEVANLGSKTMRNEELTVDLSSLSEGIYYLSMEYEGKKIVKKIIITD